MFKPSLDYMPLTTIVIVLLLAKYDCEPDTFKPGFQRYAEICVRAGARVGLAGWFAGGTCGLVRGRSVLAGTLAWCAS